MKKKLGHIVLRIWDLQQAKWYCGSLKFANGKWEDVFFDDIAVVPNWIGKHRWDADVYFCPHGFSAQRRLEKYAVDIPWLWGDFDGVDPDDMEVEPTIAVRSSPGHYHFYWQLDAIPSKGLRKGFHDAMGGDPGCWRFTQVLRVPQTVNFKPEYDRPYTVKLLWDYGPTHKLRDLRKYETRDEEDGPIVDLSRDIGGLDPQAIVKKYGLDPTLLDTCVPPRDGRPGQRSDVIWKIGQLLKEKGASPDEVAAVIYASASWRSKHGQSMGALRAEVKRIFKKR